MGAGNPRRSDGGPPAGRGLLRARSRSQGGAALPLRGAGGATVHLVLTTRNLHLPGQRLVTHISVRSTWEAGAAQAGPDPGRGRESHQTASRASSGSAATSTAPVARGRGLRLSTSSARIGGGGEGSTPATIAAPRPSSCRLHAMQSALPEVRLRPLRVTELLDTVFTLYRRNFLLFVAVIAVVQVPYQVVSFLLSLLAGPAGVPRLTAGQRLTSAQLQSEIHFLVGTGVVLVVLLALTAAVVVPLQTAAFTKAVADRFLGRVASPTACYRFAVRRWARLVLLGLIILGLVLGAAVVLVLVVVVLAVVLKAVGVLLSVLVGLAAMVGGIIVYARLSIATPALVLEGLSPGAAIRRSWELTSQHVGRAFGVILSLVIVELLIGIVLGTLVGALSVPFGVSTPLGLAVRDVGQLVVSLLEAPILATGLTLFYFDLRVRKDAFDLELLARQVLEGGPEG